MGGDQFTKALSEMEERMNNRMDQQFDVVKADIKEVSETANKNFELIKVVSERTDAPINTVEAM